MQRVYNFAAGPSTMPVEALETAAREMLHYGDSGMSVMEMSHRSKAYSEIFSKTESLVRELMHIPENYAVLFLQGGATGQFAAVAMNLLTGSKKADYVDTGVFAHNAMIEAGKYGQARLAASSREDGYRHIPALSLESFDPEADYCYITTNNTIYGTRYSRLPETGNVPLVADMSSNILSQPYDIEKFGVVFAGAQKNIGPAGFALVIARRDLLGRQMDCTPQILNWKLMDEKGSMLNTPPTYAIYMAGLCLEWLKKQGGVEGIYPVNCEKAKLLYDYLDESKLFQPVADKDSRSIMNVTFRTGNEDLDQEFVKSAAKAGLVSLKGHRSAGGMRASIYNAMPLEGVKALRDFMKKFEMEHK